MSKPGNNKQWGSWIWFFMLLTAAGNFNCARHQVAQQPPSDPKQFHLFLLAGQSNMAGRGVVEPPDRLVHARVWMLNRQGEWVPAVEPMHFDKPIAGVGPGRSFGVALAEADPAIQIGLIPAAVGGSAITAWEPGAIHPETGAYPYDEAIQRARIAMRQGELKAILWHQGESDANEQAAPAYGQRLRAVIERFRADLNKPQLPVLVGQLGQFEGKPWDRPHVQVDSAQQALSSQLANVVFVSSEGLPDKGDTLHFSAEAARTLGKRYAEAYLKLMRKGGNP